LDDAGRRTDPELVLGIAIDGHRNDFGGSAKRKAACSSIAPMKKPGGGDEEHAADAIFGEGCSDVAGDHASFGKDLNFSVNEALNAILSCNPEYAMNVFVHRTNAFVELTRTFADIDRARRSTVEDAPTICADPKIVVASIKHSVDGLVIDQTVHLNGHILKALAIEAGEPGGCSKQQNTIRTLRYHAHVVFGQAVFDLPILFLILRETQDGLRRCGTGDNRRKTDEKKRDIAE